MVSVFGARLNALFSQFEVEEAHCFYGTTKATAAQDTILEGAATSVGATSLP
jgi:hypothetical protein